jgi:hypothetical protein
VVPGLDKDDADVKTPVQNALSNSAGSWLWLLDNTDDIELFFGHNGPRLVNYLPFSHQGSILVTTRNHKAAVKCKGNIVPLKEMSPDEAIQLLLKDVKHHIHDATTAGALVELLNYLPLAIQQASTYIVETGDSLDNYFRYCQASDT